jgi:phosphoglycolate phosphatase
MKFRTILFDLDGTLIDSREDLAASVNLTLQELRLEPLHTDRVVSFVGEGVRRLMERALYATLERELTQFEVDHALEIFTRFYREHLLDRTRLYEGVRETLDAFRDRQLAVVTNKSLEFTQAILSGLELNHYFGIVLGGDSLPVRKPSPRPLLTAITELGGEAETSLMVGDSAVDIAAGRAAEIKTCGCAFGFRGRDELESAGADLIIERFRELKRVIKGGSPK